MRRLLCRHEKARADRFHSELDARRFVLAHGTLRTILGKYLGIAPDHLRFSFDAFGKPELDAVTGETGLHFNLTHSGTVVLIAVARDQELGIDVERVRQLPAEDAMLQRCLTKREYASLHSMSSEDRRLALFSCWVAKEACLKAAGSGLWQSMQAVELTIIPPYQVQRTRLHTWHGEVRQWMVIPMRPLGGYVASLAVQEPKCEMFYWDLDDARTDDRAVSTSAAIPMNPVRLV